MNTYQTDQAMQPNIYGENVFEHKTPKISHHIMEHIT